MKMICYCFGYTDADIIDDLLQNDGYSSILERIAEAKKNLTCQCDIKNPKKIWCLPDVRRVVDKANKE